MAAPSGRAERHPGRASRNSSPDSRDRVSWSGCGGSRRDRTVQGVEALERGAVHRGTGLATDSHPDVMHVNFLGFTGGRDRKDGAPHDERL
jgi:hypothetical protein